MTGARHEAADDARQGALHAGDRDDDARGAEAVAFGQQTVEAGDADVVEPVDVVAHDLGRDRRFLCHWYVRSSRRGDQDDTLAARPSGRVAR